MSSELSISAVDLYDSEERIRLAEDVLKTIPNRLMREPMTVMRVLVCPNAFKGSLTALEASRALMDGIACASRDLQTQKRLTVESVGLPLADGGDGTLETLVHATGGALYTQRVQGPLEETVEARWGRLGGARRDTAIIEMAEAAGVRLLRREQYDPLHASTFGVGQLMRAALDAGCRTLLVGIGGSATNDGGAGMAQALGARLLDVNGYELAPGGAALSGLDYIDLSEWSVPAGIHVIVACDVDNPLCGPRGASAVYGPQKGATPAMVRLLDAALEHYAEILDSKLGRDIRDVAGAGASGGLGAGLMAFCDATLRSGIDIVLEETDFDLHCRECQLVLTGEGRLDSQTGRGKVIAGVARRARAMGVPVVALVGGVEERAGELLRAEGLAVALSIADGPIRVEDAMRDAERLLRQAADEVTRLLTLWL